MPPIFTFYPRSTHFGCPVPSTFQCTYSPKVFNDSLTASIQNTFSMSILPSLGLTFAIGVFPGGFVSCSCCNKFPQAWQFKIRKMYSLRVLEVRSPKSRCWKDHIPSRGSAEEHVPGLFQLLAGMLGGVGEAFLGLQCISVLCLHVAFSVHLSQDSICLSLIRRTVIAFRDKLSKF